MPAESIDPSYADIPIRAVILDYGDVISQPPDPAAITTMAEVFNLPEDRFRHLYGTFRYGYDRGDLNARDYWSEIARAAESRTQRECRSNQLRETDLAMWSRLNPSDCVGRTNSRSSGMKTAVLSNMHDDMVQKVRKDPTWEARFDCLTLSSAIGMAKPDAAIFQTLPGVLESCGQTKRCS